jgi:hypothetical protein
VSILQQEPLAKPTRALPHVRTWNIALRTAHIGVAGALFGGHVFGIAAERLLPWLYLTVLTGLMLIFIEAYPNWRWCYQMRAVMILGKALLLCLIPWLWSFRVFILVGVIVVGSIGSHMPRRYRHYSLVERQIVP